MSTERTSATALGKAAPQNPKWTSFWLHVMTPQNLCVSCLVDTPHKWRDIKAIGRVERTPLETDALDGVDPDAMVAQVNLRRLEVARAPTVRGDMPAFSTRDSRVVYTPSTTELARQSLPQFFEQEGMIW